MRRTSMKAFFMLALVTVSSNLLALEKHELTVNKCFKKAKRYYSQNAQPSDAPREIHLDQILPAKELLKDLTGKSIASFNEDKLIYRATGSYHSGYFIDLVVVDLKTCQGEEIINIYSE